MKKANFLVLSLLSSVSSGAYALDLNNPLPNWIDPGREKVVKAAPAETGLRAVPPSGFRMPAEYEPVAGVVIGWAGYTGMLAKIAQAAAGPGNAKIFGVAAPATLSGVPADKYKKLDLPIDTVWVRDYGPFGITSSGKLGIVDTVYRHYQYRQDDDTLPANLGKALGASVFGTNIILDGGNLMVDTKGNLFMTRRTYMWNSSMSQEQVDTALKAQFKVNNIHVFDYAGYPGEPKDGTGHIDMFMKLLNDHTVLITVAETEPFKTNSEKAMAFFKGRMAPDGQPYKIVTAKGWATYGAWYTYTNSLIVNNTVIMPSYSGHAQDEAQAIAAYKAGMPNVTVVPVNSDDSITAGGSIHCVTQTLPVLPSKDMKLGPYIDVAPNFGPYSLSGLGELPALGQLTDALGR
ncbi:MAG TPA: hypothetical protein DCZ92_07010 [Elusimicrobia bacterium]|nr:MAG: hypothetical protein A2016_04955 [Elusimicrobia bacterium GWF2_62_30]HBA60555.1 hypothetical protein [Elusimicrobiota bacterium]